MRLESVHSLLRNPRKLRSHFIVFGRQLAAEIKDPNYRVFAADGEVHVVSHELHLHNSDPFALFDELQRSGPDGASPKNLDASHAFYLGYEMCKAATAMTLNKQYTQDEALDWGYLTRAEERHYLKQNRREENDVD